MKKLIYFTFILLICAVNGQSQTEASKTKQKMPRLNSHAFPSMGYFRSPFISTSLVANLGFGQTTTLTIPGIIIDEYELFSFEGKIIFMDVFIQYQQRFTPWLAMFISTKISGRVGSDMSSIMADGINTLSGGEIGWLVRIVERDKYYVSANINVEKVTGTFINVTEYFQEIINNNPYPSLVKKVPAMLMGIGFRGAYAFNSMYGIQFQVNGSFGESLQRENTQAYFSGGFVADVDFNPKKNVPIGLAIGYTLTSAPEIVMKEGQSSNLFMGKFGYTGSDDFDLGLQFTFINV
jgi:hypothetical protein